ncbi:QcrA and Rieske domain-containing protein [Anaeromyxobacter oryzae]|uniref:Cytochrome b6 n=1 Tax=Anaeromyxobacter oryzae TaxID=2918170 RepID=A0ABM7WS87_9BACT|nr:Rieske 2Fe-2S domain-containing protein [Anaeromyxobacter oryzae]BDG02352.1 cytochrome b6 [Anaeromyxobacter oryzae]
MTTPTASANAPASPGRRTFLARVWKALGIVAAAELVAVVAAYLAPRKEGGARGAAVITAGPVAEFTPASVRPFPAGKFYLVRLADGGFLALSSRCTHLGCTVPWSEKDRVFPCPCHASVFDLRGEVLSPPAPRALDLFPVVIEAGIVKVDTGRRVERTRFEPGQVTYL